MFSNLGIMPNYSMKYPGIFYTDFSNFPNPSVQSLLLFGKLSYKMGFYNYFPVLYKNIFSTINMFCVFHFEHFNEIIYFLLKNLFLISAVIILLDKII